MPWIMNGMRCLIDAFMQAPEPHAGAERGFDARIRHIDDFADRIARDNLFFKFGNTFRHVVFRVDTCELGE
jgi:hypothetical protein